MNLSTMFKRMMPGNKETETMPAQVKVKPVQGTRESMGDCRCFYCHQDFWYEDFVGICTALKCSSVNYWGLPFGQPESTEFYLNLTGPRRVLMRPETMQRYPLAFQPDSNGQGGPIEDVSPGNTHSCPKCRHPIYFYCCPICRMTMPRMRKDELKNTIAPAGIGSSGKTVYMTVLIETLTHKGIIKPNLRIITSFCETADFHRWEELYRTIYKNNLVPTPTSQEQVPLPYLVKTGTTQRPSNERKMAFTLWYDFSGESFEKAATTNSILQYFASVGGIFFFVDPTNSAEVVYSLHLNTAAMPDHTKDMGAITQINSLITKIDGTGAAQKKLIAVIVNKVDIFKGKDFGFFGDDSQIWQPSPHRSNGAFCLDDYHSVSQEVKEYLIQCHSNIYTSLAEMENADQSNIGYFAVSALGQDPKSGHLESPVNPIRVEDPFYWMLWKMGHMPAIGETILVRGRLLRKRFIAKATTLVLDPLTYKYWEK